MQGVWHESEKLPFGRGGSGGRYLNSVFQKLGAQCVALCDGYEPNLEKGERTIAGREDVLDYPCRDRSKRV